MCCVVVAVVVAFVACWAPFHAQRLMTIYTQDDQWTAALLETQSLLFYVSGTIRTIQYELNAEREAQLSQRDRATPYVT